MLLPRLASVSLLLLLNFAQTGCRTFEQQADAAPRPARLNHVVLFTLHDPDDAEAFIAACDARLPAIPAVTAYASGPPLPVDRETAVTDYDVGIYLGFDSRAAYENYLSHPSHEAVVDAWQARIRRMRVIDILDETE